MKRKVEFRFTSDTSRVCASPVCASPQYRRGLCAKHLRRVERLLAEVDEPVAKETDGRRVRVTVSKRAWMMLRAAAKRYHVQHPADVAVAILEGRIEWGAGR